MQAAQVLQPAQVLRAAQTDPTEGRLAHPSPGGRPYKNKGFSVFNIQHIQLR
jgi:hypothetical protein